MRLLLSTLLAAALAAPALASDVTVRGGEILVDGRPLVPNGASALTRLPDLKAVGGQVVRTYGEDPGPVLDAAQRAGLKVIAGFWMGHPRLGFDYANPTAVAAQLDALRLMVERYRTHPALLAWAVGNEVEVELSPAEAAPVWPAIEQAAKLVKSLDGHHPVMAVLAEAGTDKVATLKRAAPSVDIVGLNGYGDGLLTILARARSQGWTGPVILTEMGALGQWDAPKTPWGAHVEPTSTQKADKMRRYLAAAKQAGVGAMPFLWGQKQEVTPTWHSLFTPAGDWTETVQVMAETWGKDPPGGNRAPRILSLRLDGPASFEAAKGADVRLAATDPDGDPLKVDWQVMEEAKVLGTGGDAEPVPPSHPEGLREPSATGAKLASLPPGRYRVFVTVRDGRGAAATGNLPFEVR